MVRIVHVLTRLLHAGSEENTIASCRGQVRNGHEVTLLHGEEFLSQSIALLGPGVRTIRIESLVHRLSPARDLRAVARMRQVFAQLRPDVVHTHQSKAGILGRIAARLANVPIIAHGVHILAFQNAPPALAFAYLLAEKICGSFTDLFVHVSRGTLEECTQRRIGPSAHHIVAESGMDVGSFREAVPPVDANTLLQSPCGDRARPFVVLSLAALEPRKGLARFLPVLRKLADKRPNTVLLAAGRGPEHAHLEAQIESLGLNGHVRLLGFRGDPQHLLAIADALVVCSEREGLPRVVVQAGIAGVPIVTTALPGIDLIVRPGETGFVAPLDDLAPMEQALLDLIDNPALRESMRDGLRRMDFSPWQAETMVARIEAGYAFVANLKTRASFRS
jgi:glycosyltransferase involved in cell wall biosynthesis